MKASRVSGFIRVVTIAFVIASAAVLVLGVISSVGAAPRKFTLGAKGVSISNRVQSQSDLCMVGGGTTNVQSGVFRGVTSTTCNGGKQDGMKCTNTKNSTTCSMPRTVGVEDSLLGQALSDGLSIAPELDAAPDDPDFDVVPATEPAVAPESDDPSEGESDKESDDGAISEAAPDVAPEPTATPDGDDEELDDSVVAEVPLDVNPGTEGGASDGGKDIPVNGVTADPNAIPVLEIDDQP